MKAYTFKQIAAEIKNIRTLIQDEKEVVEFAFKGETVRFTHKGPEILQDNDATRHWLASRYGFLLAVLMD